MLPNYHQPRSRTRKSTTPEPWATVFLCGLWLPFWIIISASGGERRYTVTVDAYGGVHWSGCGGQAIPTSRCGAAAAVDLLPDLGHVCGVGLIAGRFYYERLLTFSW